MSASYATAAAVLREAADRLAGLGDRVDLPDLGPGAVQLAVLPAPSHDPRPDHARVVDIVATALTGRPGTTADRSTGTWRHVAQETSGPVTIRVHAQVPDPGEEGLRAEVARLRAQVAALTSPARGAGPDWRPGDGDGSVPLPPAVSGHPLTGRTRATRDGGAL